VTPVGSTQSGGLHTLEPLIDAVRAGLEGAGWSLSGLQKTTSHEFEGRWAGESTRSAYMFFHRADLPDAVAVEAFLDETSRGLRGTLALVVDGPRLARLGSVREVLGRVATAAEETLGGDGPGPVSLRLALDGGSEGPDGAEVQFRVKVPVPRSVVEAGAKAVAARSVGAVAAFEALLERPEVAELLPPLMD